MRVTKFRAWDKEEKKMGEVILLTQDRAMVEIKTKGGWTSFPRELSEVVLMQSTGLKDKNGVEIYEGDIIRYKLPRKTKPYFREVEIPHIYLLMDSFKKKQDVEVVGNIHEIKMVMPIPDFLTKYMEEREYDNQSNT